MTSKIFSLKAFFMGVLCLTAQAALATKLVPESLVEPLIMSYAPEERELVADDLEAIRKLCFRGVTPPVPEQRMYVATAGGPGASKSTILETYLQDHPNFAYLDPDQRALKFMLNTYLQELTNYKIKKSGNWQELLQSAYNKWRGASNYIAYMLMNEAAEKGYNIAHGTTSTSEHVVKLYDQLHQKGYKITLLLCYSSDENRVASHEHRSKTQGFCQVDPEDIVNKGKMFPERFPAYFQHATEIHFYWVENFLQGATHAATFKKGEGFSVHDKNALQRFEGKYDEDRKGKNLRPLGELIEGFK